MKSWNKKLLNKINIYAILKSNIYIIINYILDQPSDLVDDIYIHYVLNPKPTMSADIIYMTCD